MLRGGVSRGRHKSNEGRAVNVLINRLYFTMGDISGGRCWTNAEMDGTIEVEAFDG